MKLNTNFVNLLLFATLVSFYGCASYEPKPLPDLEPEFATYYENIDNVTLGCKTLSKTECEEIFDRYIIGNGYQPLLITIRNETDKEIAFSPDGVSLPVSSPDEVAEKCHTSTAGRATAYGVGALFIWPLAIPMIVDGSKSYEANTQLDQDFSEKNIDNTVINPHSSHTGVVFIPNKEYQESFTVKLIDRETKQKLEYHVEGLEGHFSLEDIPSDETNKIETNEP